MNLKRWLLAMLGVFGVLVLTDHLIHGVWLAPIYRATAPWWRPAAQMQSLVGFMFASELTLAWLLPVVYAKGYEAGKPGLGQGFRFGVLMALLLVLPPSLMRYFVYPYPFSLILNWFIAGFVQVVLAGVVIGYLYKPEAKK
jgi:hypothetical protein